MAGWIAVFVINFRMFRHQKNRDKVLETVLLLPTLPNIVAAATGAAITPFLEDDGLKKVWKTSLKFLTPDFSLTIQILFSQK